MARSFRFLKTLGEGAFGAVHLAEVRDAETDFVQTLAVKWLHPRWSQSAEYTKRLRDEARLLALLKHQAIVRVHGLSQIEGRLAILMEAVEGADLGRVQRLPLRAALEVTAAVAEVTRIVPFPRASIRGHTADASLNNAKVARRQPISNAL